jgi:phosphomannomutase
MQKPSFIFDVDGTLTPSRGHIDRKFGAWFHRFCEANSVFLVTGGSRKDTVSQLGEPIYHQCKRVYQCSGNDVWEGDRHIRSNTIELTEEMLEFFQHHFDNSSFKDVADDGQIEVRPGLINFSIVGRPCLQEQRIEYTLHDAETGEREMIAKEFNETFNRKGYEANVAGQTGIDITRMGNGKEQIIQDFTPKDRLIFFGDKIQPGGNDYLLSQIIPESYEVDDWKHTWVILKEL